MHARLLFLLGLWPPCAPALKLGSWLLLDCSRAGPLTQERTMLRGSMPAPHSRRHASLGGTWIKRCHRAHHSFQEHAITSDEALHLEALPKGRIVVLGSG